MVQEQTIMAFSKHERLFCRQPGAFSGRLMARSLRDNRAGRAPKEQLL
jgi:hypothetical protein